MHFQSGGFDLGLFDQAIWKFGHFLGAYNTVKDRIIFGDHFSLTLPLFGILYYIWDDVRLLLIAQAGIIVFSTIPIFLIAKRRLGSSIAALSIAVMYSLFYGIQYGVYFDFHTIIIGVAVLSWLAYFWEAGKNKMFWIFFVIALATQENMGIAVAGLAALFFFRKEHWKRAILVGILGISYSLLATKVTALFSPVGYQYWPQLPTTLRDAFMRLFDSEEKRLVWLYSYSPYSFIPLLSPGSLIAVVMDVSQYFVTGPEFSRMWSPFMHHRAILAPFLILGMIDVLAFVKSKRIPATGIALVLLGISMGTQYYFHFPLNKLVKTEYWKEEVWTNDTRTMLSSIPASYSIATQQNLVPHLSHRNEIYLIYPREHNITEAPCGQTLCWWLDFGGKPEYLVADTRPGQWLTQILETSENWNDALVNMERVGRLVLMKQIGYMKLFRINYDKANVY
jgi:uncharacterized membrane protein